MVKIYEDANEQHVCAVKVFKKSGQTKAYADADCTVQFKTSELENVFIKGALIVLEDGTLAKPVGFSVSSNIGTISYIVPNGTTATSADIAGLVSVADEA